MQNYTILISLALLLLGPSNLWADEGHQNHAASKAGVIEVGNTICPVSGKKIGGMGESARYEYQGKAYSLCCSMCGKDFQKNPEQYSKKAEESMKIQNNEHQGGCGCSHGQSRKG